MGENSDYNITPSLCFHKSICIFFQELSLPGSPVLLTRALHGVRVSGENFILL
jgi:hypothetical protein